MDGVPAVVDSSKLQSECHSAVFEHFRWRSSKYFGEACVVACVRRSSTLVGSAITCQLSIVRLEFPLCQLSKRAVCVRVSGWAFHPKLRQNPLLLETGGRHEMRGPGVGVGERGSARGLDTWGFAGDPGCETFSAPRGFLLGFSVAGRSVPSGRFLFGIDHFHSHCSRVLCRVALSACT